eukprot:365171-Chlamydomonas_euryale.AAC.3
MAEPWDEAALAAEGPARTALRSNKHPHTVHTHNKTNVRMRRRLTHSRPVREVAPLLVSVWVVLFWAAQHLGRHVVKCTRASHAALLAQVCAQPKVRQLGSHVGAVAKQHVLELHISGCEKEAVGVAAGVGK